VLTEEKLGDTGTSSNSRTEELKENICREISNIASSECKSKPLPLVWGMSMCRGTAFSTPPVICEQRYELLFIPNVFGMLSHRQNSRALSCRQCPGTSELQSSERMNFIKSSLYIKDVQFPGLQSWQYARSISTFALTFFGHYHQSSIASFQWKLLRQKLPSNPPLVRSLSCTRQIWVLWHTEASSQLSATETSILLNIPFPPI
jgi:hypothetical protein